MTRQSVIYRTRRRADWWAADTADQIKYFHHRAYAEKYAARWRADGYEVKIAVAHRTRWEPTPW